MDPPRSLIQIASQSTITQIGIRERHAAISLYLHLATAWLVVPDLKANQTDEGQSPEDKPAQGSDPYDKK
jgi:hypothetical protein